ncbi:MAG TPA: hypothetical protein VIL37_18020 [Natronosporangium sp.]
MLVMLGIAALLFGLLPRAIGATWAVVGYSLFVGFFGTLLDLPQWALNLSPMSHIGQPPLDDVSWPVMVVLLVVAIGLSVAGLAGFRRRDLEIRAGFGRGVRSAYRRSGHLGRPDRGASLSRMRCGRLLVAGGTVLLLAATGGSAPVRIAGAVPGASGAAAAESVYAGTPAAEFGEGAAGIVLPPAGPVVHGYLADHRMATRDITTAEVGAALADVQAALIATRLDHRMLIDHDPQPFIRTLAPLYWDAWFDPYLPELHEYDPYQQTDFGYLATRLAPGVRPAEPARVAGRITYGAGTTSRGAPSDEPFRVLLIVTRFVWVYALREPDRPAAMVVIRNDVTWQVPTDVRLACCRSNVGLHHSAADVWAWGVDCQLYQRRGLVRPSGDGLLPDGAFDLDQPPGSLGGCQPARDCSLPVVAPSCAVLGE